MSYPNKVHISRKDKASIAEYARDIASIWPADAERSADQFWLYVSKHAAGACESVRRNEWHEAAQSLGEVAVWWLSFIHKVTTKPKGGKDPTDWVPYIDSDGDAIIWHKYPYFCPSCFGRRALEKNLIDENVWGKEVIDNSEVEKIINNSEVEKIINDLKKDPRCTCLGEKSLIEVRPEAFKKFVSRSVSAYAEKTKDEKPENMRDFIDMFGDIYKNNVEVLTIEEIVLHLQEEVGEVSNALTNLFTMELGKPSALEKRQDRVRAFAEELADVFSWTNSLAMKLNRNLSCACKAVKLFYGKKVEDDPLAKGLANVMQTVVDSTTNLVDLIWRLHEFGERYLACEKCHGLVCNPNHQAHDDLRGFINKPLEDDKEFEVVKAGSEIY
jgi:NTP pyrophosphatase (non-canonical NTP hydrolase)